MLLMRFAPYLAEVSFAFTKGPYSYTKMALYWSHAGLEALPPACLQYIPPGLNTPLPLPLQKVSPVVKFLNLPDNRAVKATLNAPFSNGDVLENAFVDILFSAFLARFAIKYIPYQDEATQKQVLAAKLTWQIDPLLMNRVGHYTLQSSMVAGNQALQVRDEAASIIHSLLPGETVPVSLSAIGFDGLALGTLSLNLYVPTLKLIPARTNVSGIGYGKEIDSSGLQEIYQINHNQTIAQMTLPTQQHAIETQSLGAPLALMNPATVVSGTAREYVNTFDPNDHNQAFDYSAAKAAGAKIARQSTASFNQQHQGSYTLNHQGTFNQAAIVDRYDEVTEAVQINNTIENDAKTYSGETFSKTVNDYYEQVENETLSMNEQHIAAPVYTENTGELQEEINRYNINAQNIHFQGDHFTHNGTLFLNGKFDLGWSGGYQPKPFVLPRRTPRTSKIIYNQDMKISKTGLKTLAIMENVKFYYYNDEDPSGKTDPPLGNCTYGMGHLVHQGPCGKDLAKPVSKEIVYNAMRKDVAHAEDIVRNNVTRVKLTQAKFDALVCFTFNEGIQQPLLTLINQGASDKIIINKLLQYDGVYNNSTKTIKFEGGILKRCEWEAVAFGYNGPFYENLNPPAPTWGTDE